MWFSLPLEVRLDIYRRSRFLNARERVARKLAARPLRPALHQNYVRWSNYTVSFQIKDDKIMNIEYLIQHPNNQDRDILVVDICDYSRIAVFLHVNDNNTITVSIGTEYSMRFVQRRPYDQNQVITDTTIYFQWLRDRRF